MGQLMPVKYAALWLAKMAATDGVISPSERKLLAEFAKEFGLETKSLIRMAYAIANKVNIPEVESVKPQEMKGRKFEDFVVSLCSNKSRFRLIAWRSDKSHNGIYAIENLMPDLHISHKLAFANVEYFVECKFRTVLPEGKLDLSSQLPRYRDMLSEFANHELFIALGIGGTPSNPEQFYIIPSRMIIRDCVINIKNFTKCLCAPNAEAFHTYIEHFFKTRVY